MGTLTAIVIALFISSVSYYRPGFWHPPELSFAFGIVFTVFIVVELLILGLAFLPLQRAEQHLSPRILELFKNDHYISWIYRTSVVLSLLMLFMMFYSDHLTISPFICWIVALGVSFDLLYCLIKRVLSYLNPFAVVKMFTAQAKKSILNSREIDLCDSLEALSEVSLKSLQRSSTSLCQNSLEEMREIIRLDLEASKNIEVSGENKQAKASGITDTISYTLYYFFDRIELIFQKALDLQLTQVCSTIITLLGKVTLYAARCDLSLVSHVVGFIGKFSRKAEERGYLEIPLKGTCTLVEVSKVIVKDIDLHYMDLKDPFFGIIGQLDEIAKAMFKRNKGMNIALLKAPFLDLRALFQSEKIANHPDTPTVMGEIDRVLAEWDALENVLRTLPPLPSFEAVKENKKEGL